MKFSENYAPGFVILFIIFTVVNRVGAASWTYTTPDSSPSNWTKFNAVCGGQFQSPIDIQDTLYTWILQPIRLFAKAGYNFQESYTIQNNGHTVMITFPAETWFVSMLNDETKQYEAAQIHFHWGSTDQQGSEHYVSGQKYSMEAHLVCFNKIFYQTFAQAKSAPDGLAVLGFLSQVVSNTGVPDTLFGKLGDFNQSLNNLVTPGAQSQISAFNLSAVLDLVNPARYYRYQGSLTTVPCTQNVLWTVFQAVIPATPGELENLRNLRFGQNERDTQMADNFRPVQPVNQPQSLMPRTVYRSWNAASWKKAGTGYVSLTILLSICSKQFA